MSDCALVALDTDRIKEFLLASPRLRDIRGASALLDWLNRVRTRKLLEQIPPAERIYSHGGSALGVVPLEHAIPFVRQVERLYREETHSGSITGTVLPTDWAALDRDFPALFSALQVQLREAKDDGRRPIDKGDQAQALLTSSFLRFCDGCGDLPAATPVRDPEGRFVLLCQACCQKRKFSRMVRDELEEEAASIEFSPLIKKFLKHVQTPESLREYPCWEGAKASWMPEDLTEIGEVSRPSGYVGYIACDGNGVGDILRVLSRQRDSLRNFATKLDARLRDLTFETLAKDLKPRRSPKGRRVFPFEIVLLGGDDLILITAADKALQIACDLLKGMQQTSLEGRSVTLRAGVVLAHATYPITSLYEMANALQNRAKAYYRSLSDNAGVLDYLVISNASSNDLKVIRSEDLTYEMDTMDRERITLTQRPFTVTQMEALLQSVRTLKQVKFPRNRLHRLQEAVVEGRVNGMFRYLEVVSRFPATSDGRRKAQALKDLMQRFGCDMSPWRKDEKSYTTPVLDLLEVYDFVPEDDR